MQEVFFPGWSFYIQIFIHSNTWPLSWYIKKKKRKEIMTKLPYYIKRQFSPLPKPAHTRKFVRFAEFSSINAFCSSSGESSFFKDSKWTLSALSWLPYKINQVNLNYRKFVTYQLLDADFSHLEFPLIFSFYYTSCLL